MRIPTLLCLLSACTGDEPLRGGDTAALDHDVVVVGAGLAGLTVGRELEAAGHDVLLLEATDRIGGRALTIDDGLPVPLDLGAAWLHGVEVNPLVPLVDALREHSGEPGLERVRTDLDGPVFVGDHRLDDDELEDFSAEYERVAEAMRGTDAAVADLLDDASPWSHLIGASFGPLEAGVEAHQASSGDADAFEGEEDDFLVGSIGGFVQDYGADVPVRLGAPVTDIHTGDAVRVELAGGDEVTAERVVVTVSTGVLTAGHIAFHPDLPAEKWDALSARPMGLLNKVVLVLDGDPLADEAPNQWVMHQQANPPAGADPLVTGFVVRPLGESVVVGFVGGDRAWALEAAGRDAAIAQVVEALGEMYGAPVVAAIDPDRTVVTEWGATPWTLGAYSAALPGRSGAWADIAAPVGDRVFFAGEACGEARFNGSLAAAYTSGLDAAAAVDASLRDAATRASSGPRRRAR